MKEIWKDIEGYSGLYQISNLGNVKSLERVDNNNHLIKCRILKPIYNKYTGYYYVTLCKDLKYKRYSLHRLVANVFIPNIKNQNEVNHIDENKKNNSVTNLEWCNRKHNAQHSLSKVILQYDSNFNFIREWKCGMDAQRELNIFATNISKCCIGKYKTAGGYIWRYKDTQ